MITKESVKLTTYFWNNFECEICKTLFNLKFRTPQNGKRYTLLEFPVSKEKDYLVLESIGLEKDKTKCIYLLTPTMQNQEFKLGRGNDQEIRITDISVSRSHAKIRFDGQNFMI